MEKQPGNNIRRRHRSGRIFLGFLLILFGGLLLAKQYGAAIPSWLFSWEIILIAIGLISGVKSGFRSFGWMIPVVIGLIFLADEFWPDLDIKHYLIPAFIILAGLIIMFKPKKRCRGDWPGHGNHIDSEDMLETNAIFGGVKKNMISKNFKGGEVNAIFGGVEIDLTQSNINGRVVLEANQICGGTKLLVPRNWTVVSEMTAIMGGIEDKRALPAEGADPEKVLVLKGSCIFGGLEVKSY